MLFETFNTNVLRNFEACEHFLNGSVEIDASITKDLELGP